MKRIAVIIIIILFVAVLFFKKSVIEFSVPDKTIESEEQLIFKSLSLEQKIGQLFIIGIKGKVMSPELEEFIKEVHPGGILLLSENVGDRNQLKELISSLQDIALKDTGLPLFIAVDQEGGIVSRIGWADKTPQSEIKSASFAYEIGKKRGQELKDSLVNLNFAPLLDQSIKSDFIFERAFNSGNTAEFSKELIRGQKESGILSTIKHFPGYGNISFNPEDKLAIVEKMPDTLQFEKAIEANPEFVMVSNVIYKDFDEKLPFSFLPSGINYLKERLKGDYLIISDDLSQYSLLNKFPLKEVVYAPFRAGIDVLIFSGWRKDVKKGIEAFKENEIDQKRLEESLLKIIKLKNANFKNN